MVFSSSIFLFLFLPVVILLYFNPVWKSRRFKNAFLLIASLGFYAWGEPVFVFVMILSIIINWLLVILMDNQNKAEIRKVCMLIAVIYDIALLFVFKYVSFIARNIGILLHNNDIAITIVLPIGISFFTFQILSYVLDVYYKKCRAQKNIIDLALYISMFSQLIAGPIIRYETVAAEIEGRTETFSDFSAGFTRFVLGLSKKCLIANYMGFIADRIFDLDGTLSVAAAWLGAVAYTLQIFFDFSGYSDMAIGIGRMFGFHFPENFNYPYVAKSITDFWRRWHISLSSWFRDYVYIPLGGNRVRKLILVRNMFVVWLLTGIWHGANWTFVLWGLFYFVLLAFERFTGITRFFNKRGGVSRIYVLLFVIIGWVLFRSPTVPFAGHYMSAMFGFGASGFFDEVFFLYFSNSKFLLLVGIILTTPIIPYIQTKFSGARIYTVLSSISVMALFTLSLLVCIKSTYNPFIYFNF